MKFDSLSVIVSRLLEAGLKEPKSHFWCELHIFMQGSMKRCLSVGLPSLGVPGVPWHNQILADQLTLFQSGGTDNADLITTGTPGFSDLPTALSPIVHNLITNT